MSKAIAAKLLAILKEDREERLLRIDDYRHGRQDDPYIPDNADTEYKLLAKRCKSNWMPLVVSAPSQALYVDGFRRGSKVRNAADGTEALTSLEEEWTHWQASRLDSRQHAVHDGALAFGHSFTLTERKPDGQVITTGLSAMNTAAVYEDPANDLTPAAALTVLSWPTEKQDRGKARMWVGPDEFAVTFLSMSDSASIAIQFVQTIDELDECPVTRFAAQVDLEGRTLGVVEPMIPLQDRINQTVFDLLVAQTYGSFQVRTVTGMAPPMKMKAVLDVDGNATGEWVYETDSQGRPIPEPIRVNASRFMFAESTDARFGSLPPTPLDGYIKSIDMSIRHLAAVSQTPPHYLLGQIANLSAEALQAAEQSLARKVEAFRKSFGESWERVFQIANRLEGNIEAADDVHGEVVWRDVEARSLVSTADALLKLQELGIPNEGLWRRVPGVTQRELDSWTELAAKRPEAALAERVTNSTGRSFGTRSSPQLLRSEAA